MPLSKDISMNFLAEKTDGFSGADIEGVCREAAMLSLREDMKSTEVNKGHFVKALAGARASITEDIMKYYERITQDLGSGISKKDKRDKDIQYM